MATLAQTTANRANAQLSTGPRSVEGKAASSRNSTRLGIYSQAVIIPGEDPAELDALSADYERLYIPVGPVEASLVERAVRAQWMERRCARLEAEVLRVHAANLPDSPDPMGAAAIYDSEHGNTLVKIFRRQQAARRDWLTALHILGQVQAERRALAAAAASPAKPPQPRDLGQDWLRSVQAGAPSRPPGVSPSSRNDARSASESSVNLALRL